MYLIRNGLLCKQYQDHVKKVSQDLKHASLEPFRRQSAAVSRKLRLRVAHGLIHKVQKTHRYPVSAMGRLAIQEVLTIQQTSMAVLSRAAA